ncbi:MAG: indolepyruvate oxidoreductase subunit beta [Desulfatitalea sp.]|nr:indolepyruvate oxidoreductase subunit beta [Desulfatitalea sp.]NNK01822.1 indolepyruvate oxidoreductase subunit beta [Desulfatitalea sp.]
MNPANPLQHNPYNLIITGVGGQGNVLASRMVGDMMSQLGYDVIIGETFGASQRGGSVMSHLRITAKGVYSPQIPFGSAHMVVALEPSEALRVLKDYGNPHVRVICNTRPVQPVGVIRGDLDYPDMADLRRWVRELSGAAWFIQATDMAMKLGNPILANVISVGALAATGALPLSRDHFENVIGRKMAAGKIEMNLQAFDAGVAMIRSAG